MTQQNKTGLLYPCTYTANDILDCITAFDWLEGYNPTGAIVHPSRYTAVQGLEGRDFIILQHKAIQPHTILLLMKEGVK